jgi:hypothetical protein
MSVGLSDSEHLFLSDPSDEVAPESPSEDGNRSSFKNVMLSFVEQSMMEKFHTPSYPTDK